MARCKKLEVRAHETCSWTVLLDKYARSLLHNVQFLIPDCLRRQCRESESQTFITPEMYLQSDVGQRYQGESGIPAAGSA